MRTKHLVVILVLLTLAVPASPAYAGGIVSVCDEAHLLAALAGGGTVSFACSGTIILTAEITIVADTTIDGSGQAVTISGNDAVRVFTVDRGVALNLNELTVANGSAGSGGGVYNNFTAVLTVNNSTFSGNSATDFQGGGGGILNYGTVAVSNSTFFGNSADEQGGGGAVVNAGTLDVSNSTFIGNTADYGAGGAIFTGSFSGDGVLTVSNSTFSNNRAHSAGGVYFYAGTTVFKNTIVANNRPGGNCRGNTVTDGGGNLSYPGTACPGINGDPKLGPLRDNGGPTWTIVLGPGSAAIDAGIDAICAAPPVNNLDQRGVPRPLGSHCDIGAVEQPPYLKTWLPVVHSQ